MPWANAHAARAVSGSPNAFWSGRAARSADPVGTVAVWRHAVGLLPRGRFEVVDRAGHMPWLDDPATSEQTGAASSPPRTSA